MANPITPCATSIGVMPTEQEKSAPPPSRQGNTKWSEQPWSSGMMEPSQGFDPGSIPGGCTFCRACDDPPWSRGIFAPWHPAGKMFRHRELNPGLLGEGQVF